MDGDAPLSRTLCGAGKRAGALALIVAGGFFGMLFIVWPMAGNGRIPADLMDGRFNLSMLEHFHGWITGGEPGGFWNTRFFYPFPWVTTFSDNFLGSGPVYSLFRWAGLDREDAFRWRYIAGYAGNYAACAYVLVKLRLRALAVAVGAFIFTFNMVMSWHAGHAQLLYRCGVPLAVYFLYRALRERRLADWLWCFAWLVWQLYAGIYIGMFTAMLLGAFAAAVALLGLADVPRRIRAGEGALEIFTGPVAALSRDAMAMGPARRVAVGAGFAALAAAVVALFYPYAHAAALYAFPRPWWVVYRMLPRVWSYFYIINSRLWPDDWGIFDGLQFKAEHVMFTGASVWVLFAVMMAGMARGWAGEWQRPLLRPLLLAMFCLEALTLLVFHRTLYHMVYALPGFEAIRAVGRIILVLLFPMGVMCAFGVDALMKRAREVKGGASFAIRAALALLLTGVAAEAVLVRGGPASKEKFQGRTRAMQEAISAMHLPPGTPLDGPVLFVPWQGGDRYEITELDGMQIAQQNGFATLNGYSGNMPPGFMPGMDAVSRILLYFNFTGVKDESRARALAARVLVWNGTAFENLQWPDQPAPVATQEK